MIRFIQRILKAIATTPAGIGKNPDACRLFSFTKTPLAVIINMTYSCHVMLAMICLERENMKEQGYDLDITDQRYHHEIYLSDARKVAPEKLKTVIRHPIKVKG